MQTLQTIRYDRAIALFRALQDLAFKTDKAAARTLPSIAADLRVASCLTALRPAMDDYDALVKKYREDFPPVRAADPEADTPEVPHPEFVRKTNAILEQSVEVVLPDKLTEDMLPKPTKTKPDNAEGIAGIRFALVPYLLDAPTDEANSAKAESAA